MAAHKINANAAKIILTSSGVGYEEGGGGGGGVTVEKPESHAFYNFQRR